MTTTARNYWPLVPVIGLTAVAIASLCMFIAAHQVGPAAVTSQPYLDSLRQDERTAERQAFVAAGMHLETHDLGGRRVVFTLIGPTAAVTAAIAELILYRPSDAALDRQLPWNTPAQPLTIELPRHGRWRATVRITGTDGIVRSTTAELDVGG
jgi:hypothetical protein